MGDAGAQIKKLRLFFNMTQEEFANEVNVKRNSVSMIESGRNKPTFDLISDICGVFNLPADYFLSNDNPDSFKEYFNDIKIHKNVINNVNLSVNNDVNLNSKNGIKTAENGKFLIDDISAVEVNTYLIKQANSNLLYLEFHLHDILLNLKLLHERLSKKDFDRDEHEKSQKAISDLIKQQKTALKSGLLSNKILIDGLLVQDDAVRIYLDGIRDISKELYIQNYK